MDQSISETVEVYIGDYSIILHIPKGKTLKDELKITLSESIEEFGLKVIDV